MVSFKTPGEHLQIGKLAEMIIRTEGPGILNWLLEGRKKIFKDKLQLKMTPEQKARAANLLMASQSPAAFVGACLQRREQSEITAMDLYSDYQEWCQENRIRALASQAFTQVAKEEIELRLGLRYRHDLGAERTLRGWKGVGLVQTANLEKAETTPAESAMLRN